MGDLPEKDLAPLLATIGDHIARIMAAQHGPYLSNSSTVGGPQMSRMSELDVVAQQWGVDTSDPAAGLLQALVALSNIEPPAECRPRHRAEPSWPDSEAIWTMNIVDLFTPRSSDVDDV